MDLLLSPAAQYHNDISLTISGSKSESNRLLLLQALFPEIKIHNLSNSDDTKHLKNALEQENGAIDIGHAGTAMRFLTAYFSSKKDAQVLLTGSARMQERPINILVNALRDLGAHIEYVNSDGYPPLKIYGKELVKNKVAINAGVSSQYISALLLIAPSLKNGLELELIGMLTSKPYIEMTTTLLDHIGALHSWDNHSDSVKKGTVLNQDLQTQVIKINPVTKPLKTHFTVESDWSSAGYWFSWVALQEEGYAINLEHFNLHSRQGDAAIVNIFSKLGVMTTFTDSGLKLEKIAIELPELLSLDLTAIPDQAQTIFAVCLGLGINAHLTGLHTLRIKETDRIEALRLMGLRFRESEITTTNSAIKLSCVPLEKHTDPIVIDTFNDHRMAMAFAPLACKIPLIIKDAGVVSKSYPEFWNDLKAVNVVITEI